MPTLTMCRLMRIPMREVVDCVRPKKGLLAVLPPLPSKTGLNAPEILPMSRVMQHA